MSNTWPTEFRHRMDRYRSFHSPKDGEIDVSIKVRVTNGCFHREHSPRAYEIIDKVLTTARKQNPEIFLEEHESGPEILVYMTLTAAGLQFAKSVIDLIVAILKARTEGIRRGDSPHDPLKLILRRTNRKGDCAEEEVLTIESTDPILEVEIEEECAKAGKALVKKDK